LTGHSTDATDDWRKIDGVYFKLYRELLMKQYGLFRDVLSLPVGSSPQEGRSVELPIRIPDISARDFQLLLTHMFGLYVPISSLALMMLNLP